MLSNNISFKNFSLESKKFHKNLKKVNKVFQSFKEDFRNLKIPSLESYEKGYNYDFSAALVKRYSKYKNIIVIGMGGSILGTKSIYTFLKAKIKKKVFFFDTLDARLHSELKKIKNLKNSCCVVVSKSGNTIETIVNLNVVLSKNFLKNRLIFVTEIADNSLIDLATKYNAEIIEHKKFISGRYSVLSEVGMFPASLMGLRINNFKNLKKLINHKNFVSNLIQNVASIYTLNIQGIKNSVILNYDSDINGLSYWYQQLVGESLGKKGKGITPILSYAPRDHHSLLQLYLDGPRDKFFTFFNSTVKENKYKISKNITPKGMKFLKNKSLEFVIEAQCNATKNIFKLKKIPFRQITFNKKNESELGEILTFFVLETILLARLMNINPFDQPAVEEIKIKTKKFLGSGR